MSSKSFDVAIVGAGVFGAWIGWHLLNAGKKVQLIDQYGAANARASSGGQTRVIRMSYGPDLIYTRMAQRSLKQWAALFEQIGRAELFQPTGVLWMADTGLAAIDQSSAILSSHSIRHELLDRQELHTRYPQIVVPDSTRALFEPDCGALLAQTAVQALMDELMHRGAELLFDRVMAVSGEGRAELQTASGDKIQADNVVIATGPWLDRLLPGVLSGRIFPSRQEVYYFGTDPADRRFRAPQMPTWLDSSGQWYGLPDIQGRGFKIASDVHGPPIDPDTAERTPTASGIKVAREFLAQRFPALANAPLLSAEVCQYENSSNGDFLIDQHPHFDNLWIAGGGSGHGFKHGPAVGEYLLHRMLGRITPEPRFSLASKATVQRRAVH